MFPRAPVASVRAASARLSLPVPLTLALRLSFGLRQQRMAVAEIDRRVETVLRRLGLTGLDARRPAELNLDQRRRLALGRALAIEPSVLLLDEPLAHLDPIARKTLRLELAKLHRDLAVTTIHATRDAADGSIAATCPQVLVMPRSLVTSVASTSW